MCAWRGFLPAG